MNKRLISICTFLAVVFTSLVFMPYANAASVKKTKFIPIQRESKNAVEIKTNEIKSDDNVIGITLKIPVVDGMKDKSIQKSINEKFEKKVIDFKNEIEAGARDYYKEAQEEGLHFNKYEVFTDYAVQYNKNDILSITMDLYAYTGGAHGMTTRVPYNIDLKTGEEILLDDLFKKGVNYKEIINNEISKQITADKDNFYFEGAFKGISDKQHFYLKDDSLVIYFDLYEIAPYASGIPEFVIPFSLFNDGVNPKFLNK